MQMDGKNYLIVGANSGIGLAIAQQLIEWGATVYALSRTALPEGAPDSVHFQRFDISSADFSGITDFIPEVLNGLVYCPGTINLKPFNRLSEDDFIHDYRINVLGAVKSIQAAIPALKKGKPSAVVLFSTVATQVGLSFHASIAAAKSAVEGLAKSLAAEYANSEMRFNVVAPSITQTPLAGHLLNSEQKIGASAQRHPLKRIGQPKDMAQAACFLLSENSSWITGQVLHVDGGLSTLKPL